MSGLLPASIYGIKVPAGGIPVPAAHEFPATIRITMAAIDPSAEPQIDDENKALRSTLKIIRAPMDEDDDEDDDEDYDEDDDNIEAIKARLAGIISDEDMSEDDSEDEKNGGPSDPARSKKAKQAALTKKLQEELDEDMEIDESLTNGVNGKSKGKGKALDDEEIDSDDESIDSDEDDEVEQFVVCTLDPERNWQQPLDITINENEQVWFVAPGTFDIYLTGNYVFPPDMDDEDDEDYEEGDSMDYDLAPGEEDDYEDVSDSEEDELDNLENPRITEVDSDEEEAPKLVQTKKGKNKRPAESEDDASTLDALIAKNNEKLTKKQAKKLKKNDGQAVAAAEDPSKKDAPGSDKKKVQFSKNLEMGPTGSPKVEEAKKAESKKEAAKAGPRNVGGVTIDDKKVGKGRAAKKGDRIEMRYIGKLKNGKQFDANKKGKPFSFKLGVGEVIKGWDIGVQGIAPGGERRLTIPAKLAYGNKALPDIPANSELIFDIKCISVS